MVSFNNEFIDLSNAISGYLEDVRWALMESNGYVASSHALDSKTWKRGIVDDVWAYEDAPACEPAVMDIVAHISNTGLQMERMGNYKYELNNMLSAKWSFQIERAKDTIFERDYGRDLFVLNLLQGLASRSGRNICLIEGGNSAKRILFAAPLFVRKVFMCSVGSNLS